MPTNTPTKPATTKTAKKTGAETTTWMTVVDSPIGPLTLTARDGRINGLHMQDATHRPTDWSDWKRDDAQFREAVRQVEAYFDGDLKRFDLPLLMEGTEFQRSVWSGLQTIPYGRTMSYGEMAAQVGKPKACRAVGLANGRNPVAVIVPCHRVIGANGTLTGFGGGLDRKEWLLKHEQANL